MLQPVHYCGAGPHCWWLPCSCVPLKSEALLLIPSPQSSLYMKELLTEQGELLWNWQRVSGGQH